MFIDMRTHWFIYIYFLALSSERVSEGYDIPIVTSIPGTQILVFNIILVAGARALGETAVAELGQEAYRMSVECIVMPESKGSTLKNPLQNPQ